MSNSKGVYVGVCIRCEVEQVTTVSHNKQCPTCKTYSENYCPECGAKTEHLPYTDYPCGYQVYDREEEERLAWLPNQKESERGVLYFVSNIDNTTSVACDYEDYATSITSNLIAQQFYRFEKAHAKDIEYLRERCVAVQVIWAVLPWLEF